MRIIAWGTYDLTKPRTRILLDAMRAAGIDVEEVHADVWSGVRDKSQIRGWRSKLALGLRWSGQYGSLLWRYLRTPRADAVFVGYLGQLDVLLIRPWAALRGEKVLWDAFISLYDTVVNDRAMRAPTSVLARALFAWEWLSCRAADVVLLDTAAHARFFEDAFGLQRAQTASVFVGAEGAAFSPGAEPAQRDEVVEVLFYGQFIPLHGIETIIDAARASDPGRVRFVIIGQGQEQEKIQRMLDDKPLPNLDWIPWVEYEELGARIAQADICLGIFGDSDKAARVIPNKVFQILSVGKPLITRDSPAIRELLSGDEDGVYLVPPRDPTAILQAIERYRAERTGLPEPLHRDLVERFSPTAIARALEGTLLQMLAPKDPR